MPGNTGNLKFTADQTDVQVESGLGVTSTSKNGEITKTWFGMSICFEKDDFEARVGHSERNDCGSFRPRCHGRCSGGPPRNLRVTPCMMK